MAWAQPMYPSSLVLEIVFWTVDAIVRLASMKAFPNQRSVAGIAKA